MKRLMSLMVVLLLAASLAACESTADGTSTPPAGTPAAAAAATGTSQPAKPTPTPKPAKATNTPEPTATPAPPTPTPEPTATPAPPTPTPLPEPKSYSGSGSDVVAIEKPGGSDGAVIVHVTGNAESRYFGVTGFDDAGQQTDLLVNTTDQYDGITLLDAWKGQTTTRLQVTAEGDWTIEIRPLEMAQRAAVPGATSGTGDNVLMLEGKPDTAHIVGNADGRYFGVIGHGKLWDLLVNTTDPYDGRVIVNTSTVVIEVKAIGDWQITFE